MIDDTTPEKTIPVVLPVLPLRNIVVFPGMIVPLFVGREKSIRALEDVMADDKELLLVTQKDGDQDDPEASEMHQIGTVGSVLQMLKLPDGTVKVLVEGIARARVLDYLDNVNGSRWSPISTWSAPDHAEFLTPSLPSLVSFRVEHEQNDR